MKNCEHKKQNYTRMLLLNGECKSWNECRDCGEKLQPDIWKAEEK